MRFQDDSSDVTGSSTILIQTPRAQIPGRSPGLVTNVSEGVGESLSVPLKLLGHFASLQIKEKSLELFQKERGGKGEGG